ncbi:MAG: recombinase family protein [Deltaproteobacteria bacterium]|nr:recombinase family protein [Deltaproteobacteria bacterium]
MAVGQRVGYVRVSTEDQNLERQLEGVQVDRVFDDKASAKDVNRPNLQEMLKYVRDGDTVVVHSMDRLARNVIDLVQMVEKLTARGVAVEFVKEHLIFTGSDSPMSKLMLTIMGAVAEFERAILHERQREGISLAKKRGAYRGRKPALDEAKVVELRERIARGEKKAAVARHFKVSRETLYQYLKEDASAEA